MSIADNRFEGQMHIPREVEGSNAYSVTPSDSDGHLLFKTSPSLEYIIQMQCYYFIECIRADVTLSTYLVMIYTEWNVLVESDTSIVIIRLIASSRKA